MMCILEYTESYICSIYRCFKDINKCYVAHIQELLSSVVI